MGEDEKEELGDSVKDEEREKTARDCLTSRYNLLTKLLSPMM